MVFTAGLLAAGRAADSKAHQTPRASRSTARHPTKGGRIRLFLGGDVMTGRGIDQILPHPSDGTPK